MKTPFSSKSKFIWITLLTLTGIGGFTLRVLNADYFAPADTCEEVVRYMSGCSLSCSDSGPVGRYSCEKSIDEPGMQETVCTRHPYNPAITGRENGLYESSYQLGNCTVTCGGGHAMCKGDAPVRTGSVPPSTTPPTTEPEHPSGPITGDIKTGTCQGSIPANASSNSSGTYSQLFDGTQRVPADSISRNYDTTPGTCTFACAAGYDFEDGVCIEGDPYTDLPNGVHTVDNTIAVAYSGQVMVIADRNLGATAAYNGSNCSSATNYAGCGRYYQRGNNYGRTVADTITTTAYKATTTGYGPGNRYSNSTFASSSPRSNQFTVTVCDEGNNIRGGKCDTTSSSSGPLTNAQRGGPCPAGFHVPSVKERMDLTTLYTRTKGNTTYVGANGDRPSGLSQSAFQIDLKLPPAGYRYLYFGGIGSNGYYRSSSPYANARDAYSLDFNSSSFRTQSTNGRENGFSVRCFQDS